MEEVVICRRLPEGTTIGKLFMYVESFKAVASVSLYEQPDVSGKTLLTNRCRKSTKLTFTGRTSDSVGPLDTLTKLQNMMNSPESFDISYRGILIPGCDIQGFTVEDSGLDYIEISLTAVTLSDISAQQGSEESNT